MKYILEYNNNQSIYNSTDLLNNLPFIGNNAYSFTSTHSRFQPGVSVKLTTLKDMSKPQQPKITEFDTFISKLKTVFKLGSRVRGTAINSLQNESEGTAVIGKLKKFEIDYANKRVKTYLQDPSTMKIEEVYTETIERIYENVMLLSCNNKYIKTYEEFNV